MGVVQKVTLPGYTRSGQSRARQGFPRLECYPALNHAEECLFPGIEFPRHYFRLLVDKASPVEEMGHACNRIGHAKRVLYIGADCFNAVIGMLTQMVLKASYVNFRQKPDTSMIMGLQ